MSCNGCNRVGAKAPVVDFYVEQGTDLRKSFQIRDKDGVIQSIDDWTSIAGEAKREQSPNATVVFSFAFTLDKPNNRVYLDIAADETSDLSVGETEKDSGSIFYYDFLVTKSDGSKFRLQQGRVIVARAITAVA